MKRKPLYLSLAAMMISPAAWADIIQINDLTEGPSVTLINNIPAQPGSISNVEVVGETVTFTYTLPAGLVFGGNFNFFRQMLDGPGGEDPTGGVSDIFRAVWLQGASTAAISFSSDPDTIPVDGAGQLPSITENGAFQSVVTVGVLNLDFQVASDVPEPSSLLGCAGALSAIAVGIYRRRCGRR
jgi:hypothetical protein